MTVVKKDLEEIDPNEQQSTTGIPTGGNPGGQAGVSPALARGGQAQKGSGLAPNLTKYIDANKDYLQEGGITSQIQGRFADEGERIRTGIGQTRQRAEQDLGNIRSGLDEDRNLIAEAFEAPNQFNQDQQKVDRFAKLREGGYLSDVQGIAPDTTQTQQSIQSLTPAIAQAGTEEGRFGLLQDTFGQPGQSYTRGQQRLDQLLLQGTPQVTDQLQSNIQQSVGDLPSQLQALTDYVSGQKQDLTGQAQQAQTDINQQGTQAVRRLESEFAQREQARQDEVNQAYQQLEQAIASGQISPQLAEGLGLTQGTTLFNIVPQLGSFVSGGLTPRDVSMSGVVSTDDAAKFQAIQDLSGIGSSIGFNADSLGSELNTAALPINQQQFQQALANEASAFQQEFSPIARELNQVKNYIRDLEARKNGSRRVKDWDPIEPINARYADLINRIRDKFYKGTMFFSPGLEAERQYLPQLTSQALNSAASRGAFNIQGVPVGTGDVSALGSGARTQDSVFQELLRRYGG